MKGDFSELVEYLDKKFGEVATKADVDRRFDVVDRRLGGVEQRLGGVENSVVQLNNRLTTVEEKMDGLATKEDVDRLYDAVDAYAKKADTYFQEMAAMAQKLQRLERWVEELAAKVGMKLKS